MKPTLSHLDLTHYTPALLATKFAGKDDREILVEAATEARLLAEHAVEWLTIYVNDSAATAPHAMSEGLDALDRHWVLMATMAALDNAGQLTAIAFDRNHNRGLNRDPLTTNELTRPE